MTKEIVYLVGLPCSGKSTYIQNNYKDYAIISNDLIVEEQAKKTGKTYDQAWQELKPDYVQSVCRRRFDLAVKKGQSILIDNTNMTIKARSLYKAQGYEKNAVVFQIDEEERKKRSQCRAKENGKLVPESVIEHMKSIFKMPSFAEGFKNITVVNTDAKGITEEKLSRNYTAAAIHLAGKAR